MEKELGKGETYRLNAERGVSEDAITASYLSQRRHAAVWSQRKKRGNGQGFHARDGSERTGIRTEQRIGGSSNHCRKGFSRGHYRGEIPAHTKTKL